MRIRCPNCSNQIELIDDVSMDNLSCPSCGSGFNLVGNDDETVALSTEIPALRHFHLLYRVGSGKFGHVWKAHDSTLDRMVAVKVPHRENVSAAEATLFFHEARSAAQLQHPNIVTIHEVGREGNVVFIVSEFIEGLAMQQWVEQHRPDARRSAQLCADIARGLDHAHEKGVTHRDLKPRNILIDIAGNPHIADFGLAKREGDEFTIGVTGQPLGTPGYMSPEQALGDSRHTDPRSDIFSLGVILYELLTGTRPFQGGEKGVLIERIVHEDPRRPRQVRRDLPRDLETICLKALEKKPERRYQTAAEMTDDLERYLRGEPIQARPVSCWERGARWLAHRPAVASTLVLALMVTVLGAWVLFGPRRDSVPPRTTRPVSINTIPEGARVVFFPRHPHTGIVQAGRPIEVGATPVRTELEPGEYLVVAYLDDETFHEVFRHVPNESEAVPGSSTFQRWRIREGVVELPAVRLWHASDIPQPLVHVRGGVIRMPAEEAPRTVPDFLVQAHELTAAEFSQMKYQPILTGYHEHSTGSFPLTGISSSDALDIAEHLGLRLWDHVEAYYLTTAGGTRAFPWGDEAPEPESVQPSEVGSYARDRLVWDRASEPIHGLFSNAAEWTSSWFVIGGQGREMRYVVGGIVAGPDAVGKIVQATPGVAISMPRLTRSSNVGMRCARSPRPRLSPEDFAVAD